MANLVLGSGKVFFARRTGGVLAGEKLIAETPQFAYQSTSERVKEMSSDGPVAELILDEPISVDRQGVFATKDINSYNLALHVLGSVSTVTTSAGTVTADPINGGVALEADTYYQIGLAARPHVGARAITSFVLKGTAGATIAAGTNDANYTIDLTLGRLYIPAGSAAIGVVCTCDYNTTVASWEEVQATGTAPATGAIRFQADNTAGANRDYYFPDVVIAGDGDHELKSRANVSQLSFGFAIRKPTTGAAVYIDGRPT